MRRRAFDPFVFCVALALGVGFGIVGTLILRPAATPEQALAQVKEEFRRKYAGGVPAPSEMDPEDLSTVAKLGRAAREGMELGQAQKAAQQDRPNPGQQRSVEESIAAIRAARPGLEMTDDQLRAVVEANLADAAKPIEFLPPDRITKIGQIAVQFTGIRLAKVKLPATERYAKNEESVDQLIQIGIRVTNLSDTQKAWFGRPSDNDKTKAKDEHGNDYRLQFRRAALFHEVAGRTDQEMQPGDRSEDVIIFETPVAAARFLNVTLPITTLRGDNPGDHGTIRWRLLIPPAE